MDAQAIEGRANHPNASGWVNRSSFSLASPRLRLGEEIPKPKPQRKIFIDLTATYYFLAAFFAAFLAAFLGAAFLTAAFLAMLFLREKVRWRVQVIPHLAIRNRWPETTTLNNGPYRIAPAHPRDGNIDRFDPKLL